MGSIVRHDASKAFFRPTGRFGGERMLADPSLEKWCDACMKLTIPALHGLRLWCSSWRRPAMAKRLSR
jgi:hypothetical protein